MITVWALACGVLPALFFVVYDPKLYEPYPALLYIVAALGIFAYQTFDALDGKQARRIKAFSPLGQLFDHGCDSFSTAAMLIMLLVCLRVPDANINLLCYLAYISVVYMSNVNEKFTGLMMTNYNNLGVTEVQLLQSFLLLLTAFGWTEWLYVPIVGKYGLNYIIAGGIIVAPAAAFYVFFKQIFAVEKDKTEVFRTVAPIGYVVVMVFIFMIDSSTYQYTGVLIFAVGCLASNLVCKVIISTVAKKKLDPVQREAGVAVIFPLLIILAPWVWLKFILAVVFLVVAFVYSAVFSFQTVNKIARVLGIKVLTV